MEETCASSINFKNKKMPTQTENIQPFNITIKNLTKEPPRSPRLRIGGFAIIARTIDKCRAAISGNIGEYHFDCPLDNMLFGWKGIKGADFKAYVAEGRTDAEIAMWVSKQGTPKTELETLAWSDMVTAFNYAGQPDKKGWLEKENIRLGLSKDASLFDMLDADDKASFKK